MALVRYREEYAMQKCADWRCGQMLSLLLLLFVMDVSAKQGEEKISVGLLAQATAPRSVREPGSGVAWLLRC